MPASLTIREEQSQLVAGASTREEKGLPCHRHVLRSWQHPKIKNLHFHHGSDSVRKSCSVHGDNAKLPFKVVV